MLRFLLLFMLLLYPTTVHCSNVAFINYTRDNGLPSNTVYNIFRDSRGLLWIGTDRGVATYDGTSFETYTTADGLADNEIYFFQEDHERRIWMSTANGKICYFQSGKFYNSSNAPHLQSPVKVTTTNFIILEQDSSVTMGFLNYPYILNIRGEKTHLIDVSKLLPPGPCPEITSARKIGPNRIQFFTNTKKYIIDSNARLISSSNYLNDERFGYSLMQHQEYLVTANGVYNMQQQKLLSVNNSHLRERTCRVYKSDKDYLIATFDGVLINNNFHLLDNIRVSSITQDKDGNYWIGTLDKGLYLLSRNIGDMREYPNLYKDNVVFAQAAGNDIYFTTNKNNLYRLAGGQTTCIYQNQPDKLDKYAGSPACIVNGREYSAFYNGKMVYIPDIYKQPATIIQYPIQLGINIKNIHSTGRHIFLAYSNNIQILGPRVQKGMGMGMGMSTLGYTLKVARPNLWTIGHDENDAIIFSLADSVFKTDITGSVTYQPQFGNISFKWGKIFGKHIIASTTQNQLWLASQWGKKLLIDTSIKEECIWNNAFLLDSSHILLSTSGAYRVLTLHENRSRKSVDYSIQVLENPFIPKTADYIFAHGDECYFFSGGSLLSVSIRTLLEKAKAPDVYYTSLKTNKTEYTTDSIVTLQYDEAENLRLGFNAISFTGNALQYEYSLSKDGIDNWHLIQNRELNITSPGYGVYTIKVRAKTMSSLYSTPAVLQVRIGKPYWLSGWFLAASLLLFAGAATGFVNLIIRRKLTLKEQQHEVKIRFMKSEYQALNALMNPHFIFNSLNNIQSFINNDDKQSANRYLNIFSRLVRQNMQNISKELISLQKEIELVNNYLVLEKLRFPELLNFSVSVDESIDLDAIKIPPLLLQPLVENCIKHGLLPKQSADSRITITVSEHGDLVLIEVEDNGVGLTSKTTSGGSHESFALNNIKSRIEKLSEIYKQDIRFHICELSNNQGQVTGTRSVIAIKV